MSRSPTRKLARSAVSEDYQTAENRLFQLVKAGYSFSGHERNCAYLGLGDGRFANVSAVTGFDFSDDGRAMGLTDWDLDGDLDVWLVNRTAPRVRFLSNVGATGHHYLAVRLQGRSCNRDAIGARVELILSSSRQPQLIRTLRAGEGYLSQSSKWLHFGLGDAQRIERLAVHWPGGPIEEFTGLQADRHYKIVQGSGAARPWRIPTRKLAVVPSQTRVPSPSGRSRSFLSARVPLPPLAFRTNDGQEVDLARHLGAPLLINLWASGCQPCVDELSQIARNEPLLRDSGLQVVALSVDALQPDKEEQRPAEQAANRLLERIEFPFLAGHATASLVDRLQAVHNYLFKPHRPLPVPTSFLIDSSGRLAAIYKGPVDVEQLASDTEKLALSGAALVQAALPFEGRWYAAPAKPRLLPLVAELIDQQSWEAAINFTSQHADELSHDPGYPELLYRIGREMLDRNEPESGADYFRQALAVKPNDATGHYNLGITLTELGQLDEAVASYRQAIQLDATHVRAHTNLANLLRATGNLEEARDHYRQVLELNPDLLEACQNLGNLLLSLGHLDEARLHFAHLLDVQPNNAQAHNNLGFVLASRRELPEAILHYRRALQLDGSYAQAHNNLASALALQGQLPEAIEHLRQAVDIDPTFVDAYKNLGRLLLAQKNTQAAIEQMRKAERLRPDDPETQGFLAISLLAQGDLASSIRHAREAVRLDPIDARSCIRLGELLSKQGHLQEAIDWFRQALELRPDDALAHGRLGLSLASAGDTEGAILHLRQSLKLKPDWGQGLVALAHLLVTTGQGDTRRLDEAIHLAERASQLAQHRDPQPLVTLAMAYAAASRYDEAIRAEQRAIELAQAAGATSNQLSAMRDQLEQYQQASQEVEQRKNSATP